MDTGFVINLLAVILFAALIISHLNNRMWSEADKIFFGLLMVCSLCALTDTFDGIINGRQLPYVLQYTNTTCYFLFRNVTPFLYVCYIITIIDRWHVVLKNRMEFATVMLPVVADVVLILLNPWTKGIFHYDSAHRYHRGPALVFLYVTAVYYLGLSIFYAWRYRDVIMKEKRLAIYAFVPINVACIGVQIILPELRVEMFGTAICTMLIMFTIQRHEEVLEGSTGLWNRTSFMRRVYRYFRNGQQFAVVSVNIGNLRVLNETMGRLAVDDLLRDVAQYIRTFRPQTSCLYAMGNGKFNILLPGRKRKLAGRIAEQINHRFQGFWNSNGLEIQLLGSVAAVNCPEDISNNENVLKFTDEFHKLMPLIGQVLRVKDFDWDKFAYRERLEGIIENALLEKKFEVYFQPIYSVQDGRITSAEALLRLYDDTYGFISPEEFIPVAEANMSILNIDRYVLERVCEFIAAQDLEAKGIEYIEVNLSAVQCMQADMAKQVLDIIHRHGIDPHRINLEITESAMMYSPERMKENMQLLKAEGVEFSMDDFGSGYSNFNYLFEFPFSIVKLDRGIVCTREEGNKKWIALKCSIDMLQEMGFHIVAEGVETLEMVRDLTEQGCQYLQGYYFSRALPGAEFMQYIERRGGSDHGEPIPE